MKESFHHFARAMDLDEFNVIRNSQIGASLSYSDTLLLFIINHKDKMAVSELAEYINLSRPAVTQKVNALVKRGLVVKTQSKHDKRVFYLSLSDGVFTDRDHPRMADVLDEVDKHFSEEERKIFANILDFMADYLLNND